MTPERYQELKAHFYALVDCDAHARKVYLDRLAASDRGEVESLLAKSVDDFLESPLVGSIEPNRVGPYTIEREMGRGGMGVVYLAWRDDQQFRQRVALKLIKRGIDTDAIVTRF